ncbi:MAG: NAD(P)H-dependent oxidoreductase [Elusimicrobia bacterium]|nr:NAD(P)H-dependent oxidoreductase [Elusimicrobiota bacterium]
MRFPSKKNIALLSTPPTFVERSICPLGLPPVGIFKLAAFLKKTGNRVSYINMHSGAVDTVSLTLNPEAVSTWREKPLGSKGTRKARMMISGRSSEYFAKQLRELEHKPHELWISCAFTFDYDLVKEYADIARGIHPGIKVVVGGDFVRVMPELAQKVGADEHFTGRIPEADDCVPDFSFLTNGQFGMFQLQTGCVNKCSFCHISMDRPQRFGVDGVIAYMKEFYDKHHPECFWNWDPNVALYPQQFEEFLDKYIASGMKADLRFAKGLQPNRITEGMMKKMAAAGASATLPMECANYEATKRLHKPYTIISSVKLLHMAKQSGVEMSNCPCTSLLGYPDDDFGAFFRIYLAVLRAGASPAPFPVYLFPGSPDYRKYYPLIKHKDLSELHGQLWPLLPDEDLDKYQSFFKFLEDTRLGTLMTNINMLTRDLKEILLAELKTTSRFTELCLNAKKDTLEEFHRIEKEMKFPSPRKRAEKAERGEPRAAENTEKAAAGAAEATKEKAKRTKAPEKVLYVVANPMPLEKSVSRQMGKRFMDARLKAAPKTKFTTLDLCEEGLTFINREYVEAVYHKSKAPVSAETKRLMALADKYIKLLRDADEVIFATPMYTLSIPAVLKAFLELVASRLYYYEERMLEPRPTVCLLSRDGDYRADGKADPPHYPFMNVQETILTAAIGFLGLSHDVKFIAATALGDPDRGKERKEKAMREVEEYASAV